MIVSDVHNFASRLSRKVEKTSTREIDACEKILIRLFPLTFKFI